MTYEEAVAKWAAEKFSITEPITKVDFDIDIGYGGGCETCGWGADETEIEVAVTTAVNLKGRAPKQVTTYTLSTWDFGTMIQEIVAVSILP